MWLLMVVGEGEEVGCYDMMCLFVLHVCVWSVVADLTLLYIHWYTDDCDGVLHCDLCESISIDRCKWVSIYTPLF